MSEAASGHGFIVVRRGVDALEPFAAGDEVDVYELDEPLSFPQWTGTDAEMSDAHTAAVTQGTAVKAAASRLSQLAKVRCPDCPTQPRTLATLVVDDHGQAWVIPTKENVPKAFRNQHRETSPPAWPLHSHGDGPHIEIVTCTKCKIQYVLAISGAGVGRAKVRTTRRAGHTVD